MRPDLVGAELGDGGDRLARRRVLDRDPGLGDSLGYGHRDISKRAYPTRSRPVPPRAARDHVVVRTLILSDLHLGSGGDIDLLRRPELRETLWAEVEGVDEVVLLGDAVELRDRPLAEALGAGATVLRRARAPRSATEGS